MTIAGFNILACPHCEYKYKTRIIGSFNMFVSKRYSDGFIEGSWPTFMPKIVKCVNEKCSQFFNVNDAKIIAKIDKEEQFNWEDAFYLTGYELKMEQITEALETDFGMELNTEIFLRNRIHEILNHGYRKNPKSILSEKDKDLFYSNMQRLIDLNTESISSGEKIHLAELYREAGDFDACIKILSEIKAEHKLLKPLKEKIYSQAKLKKDKVFDLDTVFVKKEYRCTACEDSLILIDFDKMENHFQYQNLKCMHCKECFNAPTFLENPAESYKLSFWQKLFKTKMPYSFFVLNIPQCPKCRHENLEVFNPEIQNCVKCRKGKYEKVEWFINDSCPESI